jgi:hypothetical protein
MVINVFKNSKSKMRIVFVLICSKKDQETLFLSKMDLILIVWTLQIIKIKFRLYYYSKKKLLLAEIIWK